VGTLRLAGDASWLRFRYFLTGSAEYGAHHAHNAPSNHPLAFDERCAAVCRAIEARKFVWQRDDAFLPAAWAFEVVIALSALRHR
jgi:hypothetical protein